MNNKINTYLILVVICIVATFLRFWQLGQNPPSLTWDEVAWGYNAYSLGIDGRDEFGRFLPVDYLESFGDFKPPMYAYLDVLPIKLLGLTEFAVRFPSAFFGVLTVLLTYFLVKRIFPNSKSLEIGNWKLEIPVIAAAVLAISPWHVNLSRAAFEANVATFFIISGVWLFLGSVQEKKWYLPLASISFVLSMYTFNTARIVAPLLVLMLAISFRKQLLERKKHVIIAILIGIILVAPLARFMLTPQARLRFQEVNIFSDIGVVQRVNQEIANDGNSWWSKILHNRRFAYGFEYLHHYFDNLNPYFLFIKGDGNPKFSTQDVGQLYLWELPFLIGGVLFLFRKREGYWWIIPVWLFIGIIPAATARETPHALRIETTLPTFQILVAYGITNLITATKKKNILIAGILMCAFLNFLYYYHGYYAHYPREFSGEWQYGYKDAITYASSVENQYNEIFVTESLGRPYIYTLFYKQYDPRQFRVEAAIQREVFGFVHVRSFGKYYFADNFPSEKTIGKKLYIDVPGHVPQHTRILKTFNLLNGNPSLVAYEI